MPAKDFLPAAVRAAATDRKLKSGAALFHLGDKTRGACAASIAPATKSSCSSPVPANSSPKRRCFRRPITATPSPAPPRPCGFIQSPPCF
jgi:hypothetical protein